jgi:trans-2,3-dihydro-3-hydroxyanthranilate isomerase
MRYYTADVFTDQPFGGNQLAVFPDGRSLSDATMLALTREFNYAEVVFVLPPNDPANTRRLRIFTSVGEVPFAGHPTIGAAIVLSVCGEIATMGGRDTVIQFEEGIGVVSVTLRANPDRPLFAQFTAARPVGIRPAPARADLAAMLSLIEKDIVEDGLYSPCAASCGLPFVLVPLRSRAALARARMNPMLWQAKIAGQWATAFYPFVVAPNDSSETIGAEVRHVYARMFAPDEIVPEDPATGSAAAALSGYLAQQDPRPVGTVPLQWTIHQGIEMRRPSRIDVEVDREMDGVAGAIRVGGSAVIMSTGEFLCIG